MPRTLGTLASLVASVAFCGCSATHAASPAAAAPGPATPSAADQNPTAAQVTDLPEGESTLTNLALLQTQLGLAPYYAQNLHGQGVKIAILDNGFAGLNHSIGLRLPPGLAVPAAPANPMEDTTHGTKLAEIVYALTSGATSYDPARPGPELILLNANGLTNFNAAVAAVIAQQVDIVLYSQVWEYGDNFDGRGFINAAVDQATAAGILWINAAGNLGLGTFNSAVASTTPGAKDVALPYQSRYVRFTVPQDGTPVRAVLSWNDWTQTAAEFTSQDLDLVLEDLSGHEISASRLLQSGPNGNHEDPNFSAYPREIIATTLNAGTYALRIEDQSQNFSVSSRLRLVVDGNGVRMIDGSTDGTVLLPGDDPSVLTVGALDAPDSGITCGQAGQPTKPEVSLISAVVFSDGESHSGTSSAAAIVAGTAALMHGAFGPLSRSQFLQKAIPPPPSTALCQLATLVVPPPAPTH